MKTKIVTLIMISIIKSILLSISIALISIFPLNQNLFADNPVREIKPTAYNNLNDEEKVSSFVQSMIDKISSIINDMTISEEEKINKLHTILGDSLDIEWMAKFVMGVKWKLLDDKEQGRYVESYYNYLINSYAPSFFKYSKYKIIVTGVKPASHGQFIVLTKVLDSANPNSELVVSYRCKKYEVGTDSTRDKGERILIRDVIGEGISMISTQRSEFSDIINQGGPNSLIDVLNSRRKK